MYEKISVPLAESVYVSTYLSIYLSLVFLNPPMSFRSLTGRVEQAVKLNRNAQIYRYLYSRKLRLKKIKEGDTEEEEEEEEVISVRKMKRKTLIKR